MVSIRDDKEEFPRRNRSTKQLWWWGSNRANSRGSSGGLMSLMRNFPWKNESTWFNSKETASDDLLGRLHLPSEAHEHQLQAPRRCLVVWVPDITCRNFKASLKVVLDLAVLQLGLGFVAS